MLPETVWFAFGSSFGHVFGVDQVSGAPVALNETPSAGDVHGVPRVTEPVVLETNPRLVTGRFRVALDHHAVQPRVTNNPQNKLHLKITNKQPVHSK